MPSSTASEKNESSSKSSANNAPPTKRRRFNPVLSVLLRPLLFALGLGVSLLPRKVELQLGPLLGRIYMHLDGKRRRIAYDNIRRCLPELGAEGWDKLLRANFEHYGVLGLELLHLLSPIPGHYPRYTQQVARLEGLENWKKAHGKGKGVIFVSAHLANWELMAAIVGMNGVVVSMATRHLKPEWLHKQIEASRLSAGMRCAYLPNTLPHVLKALRKGESFGFVLDQYAPPPMGVPVKFFGVDVDTLAAVGTLAQRYGAAIVPISQYRDRDGVVHIIMEPEMDLGEALQDPVKATAILVQKVETWIRANPAQWLWAHRRFKNVIWPEETAAQSR